MPSTIAWADAVLGVPTFDRELRRRVFYALYTADRLHALYVLRLPSLVVTDLLLAKPRRRT